MTRLLHASQSKTIELLRYNNMIRRHLLPPYPPILDYTRAHADDIFHEMWTSNSLSAPKDFAYRVFREWSLVARGQEELLITASEIRGSLDWARLQAIRFRGAMLAAEEPYMIAYRAHLMVEAVKRCQEWEHSLGRLLTHIEEYEFANAPPEQADVAEAWA